MANEKQWKGKTVFVATRGVREYRATIPVWVHKRDAVLEIGCEWGTTTTILAQHAAQVIAVDISQECITRARERHPEIPFYVLDGFEVRALLDLGIGFTKIYIDISGISGYRSLLDTIALLNTYAAVLRPQAIVVKSGALKQFATYCKVWLPTDSASTVTDSQALVTSR